MSDIGYKAVNGINGSITVYLDSAKNLQESKRDVSLLEQTENWSIMLYNKLKEKRNERINVNN